MSTPTQAKVHRPGQKQVEVYDFRRPTTLVREHYRILEMAFESFARQWGTQLTARVRVVSQVSLTSVSMKTYDDYISEVPSTTTVVVCELEGYAPRAVIQFPHTDALTWIAHMLGAGGPIAKVDRKFTDMERALVTSIMEETVGDLRRSLGRLLEMGVDITSIQHNSRLTQAAPTAELMIVATFNIRVGERACTGSIALPSVALMANLSDANPAEAVGDPKARVRSHLARTPVEVSVRLAPTAVRPSQIMGLKEGDVIPLPHPENRPYDVIVDEHLVARAVVGQSGSRLAYQIVTIPEETRK